MEPVVLLVDDHDLLREGLRAAICAHTPYTVAAEAADASSALRAVETLRPALAILDVALPGMNGIHLAREILRLHPTCKILMLSMHSAPHYASEAFAVGVRGYALKSSSAERTLEAIRTVLSGETYLDPALPRSVIPARVSRRRTTGEGPLAGLTAREVEVFDLVVHGGSNATISSALGISVKTVETHRTNINRKLRAHSTGELVRYAAQQGLLRE